MGRGVIGLLTAAALLLAGCSAAPSPGATAASPDTTASATAPTTPAGQAEPGTEAGTEPQTEAGTDPHAPVTRPAVAPKPLRRGERFLTVSMPRAYTPKAPNGTGTDDYRCFLLDPRLRQDTFLTGMDILPGNPAVVHHVILFRVPPGQLATARRQDRSDPGQGWTCFGGSGIGDAGATLDDAPWLGAWAPGGGESVMARDLGMPLAAGTRIVMQVHYNLLAGAAPDVTRARLRVADGSRPLAALQTMLLPAPVELPCRPGRTGPLCSREAAVADVQARFGFAAGQTANALKLFCESPGPGPVQSCDRPVFTPATIRAVAGHMHLLGRSIRIEVNPGRPDARTVLDIPVWNFDDQGSRPLARPVRLRPGDTVRVTCRHDQELRDLLPAFHGQPERYVVWGEGTTDEMCLGILLVTRP